MARVKAKVESISRNWVRVGSFFAWPSIYLPIAEWLEVERAGRRLFLWVPILFAMGLCLYFAAPNEPSVPIVASVAGVAWVLAAFVHHRHYGLYVLLLTIALVVSGFGYGAWHSQRLATQFVPQTLYAPIQAWVVRADERENDFRVLFKVHSLTHEKVPNAPQWVRVNVPDMGDVRPGDFVSLNAHFFPPPQPSRPDGYNFARDAYFMELGAVGYARDTLEKIETDLTAPPLAWALAWVERLRLTLHTRIVAMAGDGQKAQVAAALISGKRAGLDDDVNISLQASGLVHILSISGLHLMLFGGALFWLMRQTLAIIPGLALRFNIKGWSAFITALGVTFYSILSGFEVATERSLIMMLVSLIAVMLNRRALSLRNVAISAFIVFLHRPESVISISAQLSFASVTALIVGYENGWIMGKKRQFTGFAILDKLILTARITVMTGILASLATVPLIAYQFQRVNPWGLVGNILTEPITAFVIMPSGLLGLMTMPFGFDAWFWKIMAFGSGLLLDIAAWVGGFSHAIARHSALSPMLPAVFGGVFCWFMLWKSHLKFFALLGLPVLGYLLFIPPQKPIAYVDPQGRSVGVRAPNNQLLILNLSAAKFAARVWLDADGDGRHVRDESLIKDVVCDKNACEAPMLGGGKVVLIKQAKAIRQACLEARLVVAPFWDVWSPCKAQFVDRNALPRLSSAAIYEHGEAGFMVQTTRHFGTQRPWQPTLRPITPYQKKSKPEAQKPLGIDADDLD